MIFEPPFMYFIGVIVIFISFVIMRLKNFSFKSCLLIELCILAITYMLATTLFPLTFSSRDNNMAVSRFDNFIPFYNLAHSRLTLILANNISTYYYHYTNLLIKHFVLEISITAIVSAVFFYFKQKLLKSIVNSTLLILFFILVKIIFFSLGISQSSIFDTGEFFIVIAGGIAGAYCMKNILKYKAEKIKENEQHN